MSERLRTLWAASLCLVFSWSCVSLATEKQEVVRGWKVTPLSSTMVLFEKPEKRLSAVFSVESTRFTSADLAAYVLSPRFFQDIAGARRSTLFPETDFEGFGNVAANRERSGELWIGVVESDFKVGDRTALMSERMWIRDGLLFHFLISSNGALTPSSESHREIFDEFKGDFGLAPKQASIFDFFVEEAHATETVRPDGTSRSRPTGGAPAGRPRPPPLPPSCKDRSGILNIEASKLRTGGPALHPNFNPSDCGAGAVRALEQMKSSIMGTWSELERQTERYIEQQRCNELAPRRSRNRNQGFWRNLVESFGNASAAQAYSECLSAAGTRAAVGMAVRPIVSAGQAVGTYLATGGPAKTARRFYDFLKAGGRPHEYIIRYYSNKITGFTCLSNAEQTRAICGAITKVGAELAAAAATAGTAAVAARAGIIARAVAKGLDEGVAMLNRANRAAPDAPRPRPGVAAGGAARPDARAARATTKSPARPSSNETVDARRTPSRTDGTETETDAVPTTRTTDAATTISRSPTEVLVSSDDMTRLNQAMSQQRLSTHAVSSLSSTVQGQRLGISVTRGGRSESLNVTREEAIRLSQDSSVTDLRIETIKPVGTTPRLTAAQQRKISPDVAANLSGSRPDSVASVMVKFKSGEVGIFTGNPQMIRGMAAREDVTSIDLGMSAPSWLEPTFRLNTASRTQVNPIDGMRRELTRGSAVSDGRSLGYDDQVVFHGTVRENVASVKSGPQNVGAGFGGRGLYLAREGERDLAENYSKLASGAAENRVANVAANVDPTRIDRTAVVMRGRLNPEKNFRVGVFEVGRDIFVPDLKNGRLPTNWDDDPRLRQLIESEFDVIEIRNARTNGMNISSDRYLVVHERAGADAIVWQRTDVTNRPPRPSAQPLPVDLQNVKMAADSWRANEAPSRNFLPRLNVSERQEYAARILSNGRFDSRQSSAFQRSAREFQVDYWSDAAKMETYRRTTTETLRRAGFSDEQIGVLFDSGALTGARPR